MNKGKDKNIDNYSEHITMFKGSKLSFKSKKMWFTILIPPIFLTSIVLIVYLISGNTILIKDNLLVKFYFACCFLIFIAMLIIDGVQVIYNRFVRDSFKGKIVSIIILITLLIKAIWEISRIKNK